MDCFHVPVEDYGVASKDTRQLKDVVNVGIQCDNVQNEYPYSLENVSMVTQTDVSGTDNEFNVRDGGPSRDGGVQTMSMVHRAKEMRMGVDKSERIEELKGMYKFLKKTEGLMQSELQHSNNLLDKYDVNWEEEVNEMRKEFNFPTPSKVAKNKSLQITDLKWNCKGNYIAASYGNPKTTGWCLNSGWVAIWSLLEVEKLENKPKILIQVPESYVTAIAFHPRVYNILVGGTYDGIVKWWQLGEETESLRGESVVHPQYSHQDPIVAIDFLRNAAHPTSYVVLTMSTEGKISIWSQKNPKKPIAMYHLRDQMQHPVGGTCFSFLNIHAGRTMAFTQSIPTTDRFFVVGTEVGGLFKAQLSGVNLLDTTKESFFKKEVKTRTNETAFEYEGSMSSVHSIQSSPFESGLFITASGDGTIRIYNVFHQKELKTLKPGKRSLYTAQLSPFRPTVFACGGLDGKLYIYDLHANQHEPAITIDNHNPICKVQFNPIQKEHIATGDSTGRVMIWKLNSKLMHLDKSENETLKELSVVA